MPELPEVETIRRSLLERIDKSVIRDVFIYHPDVFLNIDHLPLQNWQIQAIRRRGKYLLFDLLHDDDPVLSAVMIIHLRMTGKLLYEEHPPEIAKHTHVRLQFDQACLDFNDVRRFGRIALYLKGHELQDQGYASLGPEPLSSDFSETYFLQICKRFSRSTIKALLLNQKAIAGIGNIYADESLFRAGIRPGRRVGSISGKKLKILYQKIREVLAEAIGHHGTSFRDYVDGLGNKGFFQLQLAVYQRTGEPCPQCVSPIRNMQVARRSSHYCPNCQK